MSRIAYAVALAALCVLPLGCDRAEATRGAQVAAKVNGAEILVNDLKAAGAAPSAQALESIIDRELLVQKALEEGLERDAQVAQAIDHARRQILAQAWVERSAGNAAKAGADEVRAFYAENKALFAQRRIYRLHELVVSAAPEMVDVLRAEAVRAKDLEDVADWLRTRNAKFSAVSVTQPAEQLPLRYLPQLARMSPGEIAVFASPMGASVIQLVHAEDAALSEQQAAPVIEQFLAGRKRLEVAAAEVRRLRDSARIEYVGEFRSSK
jgi:EpsD family peptidyl-prolyl cis-trans isomerase